MYAWSRELVVTNISDHPIILAMNFNGERGGIEEVFSLGLSEDKGSLEYVGQRVYTKKVSKKSATASGGTYTQTVKTGCYTRNINGKNKTSCYKEIH